MDEDVLDRLSRSVVALAVSFQEFDPDRPWTKRAPSTRYAQAAVVLGPDGPLLLTAAQMISGATLIDVEREGRPPRAPARVVHRDVEINLALLTVDDPSFWEGLAPLRLASFTPTSGTLAALRWTNQQFEAASVRVKRMTVAEGWFGRLRHAFLLGRSDIANGGWAEPVVAGDALVGLCCSQDDHACWVIPAEVLSAYLEQARNPSTYVGFGAVRFSWTWTTDPALASWLGLPRPGGAMIRSIPWGTTGHGVLRPRDVLLSFDGRVIDSRGFFQHPRYGWLEFPHLAVEGHRAGDVVPVTVWRDNAQVELQVTLHSHSTLLDLIPVRRGEDPPPYAVIGGLVFIELDGDYLRTWGAEWWNRAPQALVSAFYLNETAQTPDQRRVIVLTQVLPTAWSIGYQDVRDLPVKAIDGRPIDSIEDVVRAFTEAEQSEITLTFGLNDQRSELVVDRLEWQEVTTELLEAYGIPAPWRLPNHPPPPFPAERSNQD